ncbi:Amidohydrolase [Burkholderia lata]|uniref:Amidohydrolase n=1 Tax=Burkholderia lata (strain ATCC 17760 / DSM 23089 / LMG 22485 / NCIMB 9086 / R18194 / 383) TaxID=482957 RepID=A0A6P2U3P5_BURL3|nr:M20 aminoacylase family protein [Burkholderia lata]VWC64158.1 Amidohydrolase [Burkholderia lata]
MHPLLNTLHEDAASLTQLRRDIHAHPELGYEEVRTAGIVARTLRDAGLDVVTSVAGTGVVGTLRAGSGTQSIGLTADMDALPMRERNVFAHRSRHDGKMHGCGHDGHTAMLLGAARHLARTRRFDGTVHFIFRPAEEGGAGALRMLDEGLLERFPCDAIFGMHNVATLPEGAIGTRVGAITACTTVIDIEVTGKGAHAARPHLAIDPVTVAAQIVLAATALPTQVGSPDEPIVLSITQIAGGDSPTVIPESVRMRGTLRTFSLDATHAAKLRLASRVDGICAAYGARATVRFDDGYPPTVCSPAETALAVEVGRALLGQDAVFADIAPTMAGDDFAYLLQRRPGAFLFIGNGNGEHRGEADGMGPCIVHNPWFDFNDALLPVGAGYWVALVERYLASPATVRA